jgi:hypothetical protein
MRILYHDIASLVKRRQKGNAESAEGINHNKLCALCTTNRGSSSTPTQWGINHNKLCALCTVRGYST